jgi:hypothetical protein
VVIVSRPEAGIRCDPPPIDPEPFTGCVAPRFLVRATVPGDRDVYGHTVNLAARIAGQAKPGEILVGDDFTGRLDEAGIRWEDADEVRLKGVRTPLRLLRIDPAID